MIDGCAEWQKTGLIPPPIVTGSAEAYFDAEDHILHWLDESCHIDPALRVSSKLLFASWSAWAKERGFEPGSTRSLGEHLRARGFLPCKVGQDRGWSGLTLRRYHEGQEGESQ